VICRERKWSYIFKLEGYSQVPWSGFNQVHGVGLKTRNPEKLANAGDRCWKDTLGGGLSCRTILIKKR